MGGHEFVTTLYQNYVAHLVAIFDFEAYFEERCHCEWGIGGEVGQWVKGLVWMVEFYNVNFCMLIWGLGVMAPRKF